MLLALLPFAVADDLSIQVHVPGAEPVQATLEDVRAGASQRIEFPGPRRSRYALTVDVLEAGGEWRIAFDLSARWSPRGDWEVVMRPTMHAPADELARVSVGGTEPLGDAAPGVARFHGYQIDWIVRPE